MSVMRSGKVKPLHEKWGKKADLDDLASIPCLTQDGYALRLLLLVRNALPAFLGWNVQGLREAGHTQPRAIFALVLTPAHVDFGSW
jgi:hypothetical protein